ncbi:hypothetical protein FM037_20375 [Shewanella psychropiezotolerans]|uniref:Uncharacterized protein n=1 Tax=Shewanella psychropiezotolerans TaxID=2593655 RepID=A0ABX5X7C6_9GAMM|nr:MULTISPECIES: hypothetical protein [Shewanella]MPY21174.1 hypothetical protein [Shewanella sp. YLB-07]MPY21961.1 hypothetical protein [Shewanella sp. YLB-07]QDO85161.1 hypothetical protein FM037_20375 [Shewanella psychropiezotolerans]
MPPLLAKNSTNLFFGFSKISAISLLLFAALTPNVFAADSYASVSYGTIQEANEIANPWYASATYGYTIKMIGSEKLVRIESQTNKIMQGDCVAIDSSDKGKSVRRTNNSYCAIKIKDTSDNNQSSIKPVTDVKQAKSEHKNSPKMASNNSKSSEITDACQLAIDLMKQKDFGPERRKARQHAYQVCEEPN